MMCFLITCVGWNIWSPSGLGRPSNTALAVGESGERVLTVMNASYHPQQMAKSRCIRIRTWKSQRHDIQKNHTTKVLTSSKSINLEQSGSTRSRRRWIKNHNTKVLISSKVPRAKWIWHYWKRLLINKDEVEKEMDQKYQWYGILLKAVIGQFYALTFDCGLVDVSNGWRLLFGPLGAGAKILGRFLFNRLTNDLKISEQYDY